MVWGEPLGHISFVYFMSHARSYLGLGVNKLRSLGYDYKDQGNHGCYLSDLTLWWFYISLSLHLLDRSFVLRFHNIQIDWYSYNCDDLYSIARFRDMWQSLRHNTVRNRLSQWTYRDRCIGDRSSVDLNFYDLQSESIYLHSNMSSGGFCFRIVRESCVSRVTWL
jgi:hypothetical protein